jgi:hypothetical protein
MEVWSAMVTPVDNPLVCEIDWTSSSCGAGGCVAPSPLKANDALTVKIPYLTQGTSNIDNGFGGSFLVKLTPTDPTQPAIEFSSTDVGGAVPHQAITTDAWRVGEYTVEAYKNRARLCDIGETQPC